LSTKEWDDIVGVVSYVRTPDTEPSRDPCNGYFLIIIQATRTGAGYYAVVDSQVGLLRIFAQRLNIAAAYLTAAVGTQSDALVQPNDDHNPAA